MCGIAGAYGERAARGDVERQLALLGHRGPDCSGVHLGKVAVIGQTRLSVIDLVTGDPPVANEDGTVGVALNGEVYNYRELRKDLVERGHRFATSGDTEVIAHLAEEVEPVELAAALNGMFALAVADDRRRRLVLARDRFGKKPLYVWQRDGHIVFASELKAVLAHPLVTADVDASVIPAYLGHGYVPEPRTAYHGIVALPPGHVAVASASGLVVEPYWQLQPADRKERVPLQDAAREVRRLLVTAVEKRLVADVEVGAFLSGGVDSSAVVGAMREAGADKVRTFTIGFEDDDGFDERPYASVAAQAFDTEHTEFVVRPDAASLVSELVAAHDQPFADSSAIPTFLLSQLTRSHVRVALSGDGGDEVFGGYRRFSAALGAAMLERVPGAGRLGNGAARVLQAVSAPPAVQRFVETAARGVPDALRRWVAYVPDDVVDQLVPGGDAGRAGYRDVWQATAGLDLVDRLLVLNIRTYLLNDLLPKVDRMSMAHGLELRSPFLDRDLVAYAFSLPGSYKVRGLALKRVLKAAVDDLVPQALLIREKRGFGVPLDRWFRTDLAPLAGDLGRSPALGRHLRLDEVRRLVAEHAGGARNHGHALWSLLVLKTFLEERGV